MMLEQDATIMFGLGPDFPREDVESIARRLEASGALTPGFIAPPAGLLAIPSMLYAEHIDRIPTVLLPDRNVITRMARIARDCRLGRDDPPSRLAVDLMAFAQALNVGIEPGLAFQELIEGRDIDVATKELQWFRVADTGRATEWIDLAMGRTDQLSPLPLGPPETLPSGGPPHRWRCNYAVLLKATSLELDPALSAIARFKKLLEWMVEEFILAGPAAVFCTMFFSERAARGGLIKSFKSPDRGKALLGVKNAAWDVTYLSELTRRAAPHAYEKARCIFASADRALADLAPLLLIDEEDAAGHRRELSLKIHDWWGRDAERVADMLSDAIAAVQDRPAPTGSADVDDYVGLMISEGEVVIRKAV